MRILHTSDIHLKEYEDERWGTLQKLIEIGKKEKVDVFVVSGDLFDNDIKTDILRTRIRNVFTNTGFKIVLAPGNHDSKSYQEGDYFGSDAVILNDPDKPFESDKVRFWALPFSFSSEEQVLKKLRSLSANLSKNKKNILLYHGELLDAFFSIGDFGEEGEEGYMPVKLAYFKDLNIDYVLAGHFHSKFEMWSLENGGYFVYPGSPISITKKEIGRRKVNIFEIGGTPKEYAIESPYFDKVHIEIDPNSDESPVEKVKKAIEKIPVDAKIILTIKGYLNSKKFMINENELVKEIRRITNGKIAEEPSFEFVDISKILEDDLFKTFQQRLGEKNYSNEKKKLLLDIAIKAMVGAR